jgi:glutathione synthase/RimK-type ligase-like ATP-grasp enzyme
MNVVPKRSSEIQFGLAYNWQYDADFIHALDRSCHQAGISTFIVGPHNLQQTCLEVNNDERRFRWFLDRASDEDKHFLLLNQSLQSKGTHFLNAHDRYLRASDKAEIHSDLLTSGLRLPLTVVLPSHDRQPEINPQLIEEFAKPFVVKPARGGGGRGVVTGGTKVEHVTQARTKHRDQRFLLQQSIEPQILGGRRAWFRVYFVCGHAIPCWWDDRTHRYAVFTPSDAGLVNVGELERIVRVIAEVAHLDFFSTEIALDLHNRYVVVDYVNTPCDMRQQSKHFNGVPDTIVHQIIVAITGHVKSQLAAAAADTSDADLWP